MAAHNPVTTILARDRNIAHIHFHCPCGTNRTETILDTHNHPAGRYTAAIRRLHARGAWPAPAAEPGDADAYGWPPAKDSSA